jgi:hypothetical protein
VFRAGFLLIIVRIYHDAGQQNITFVCSLAAHWEGIDRMSFRVGLADISIVIASLDWLLGKLVFFFFFFFFLLLLLLLPTAIELSLGGSSPNTSTDKTNNKYTQTKQYKK